MINSEDIKIEDLPEEFREVADAIGLEAALKLLERFQGCQVYVPKLETVTRKSKYRRMYEDFRRYGSYKRVAVKSGLSESRTRQIIKDERRRKFPRRFVQPSLF
ncbi:MAG: hypothetical protein MI862_26110 [Desulfobacterales bacterium]|nr:hypothetical protein [Desulfobacterales bacterium]